MTETFTLSDKDREYMLGRAVERYTDRKFPEAEKLLRGLLAACPDEWRAWQLLGSTLASQGYRVAAEQLFRRALELNPEDVYSLAALAEIALDALRWDDAKPLLQRAFALDPEGKHPAANRARVVLQEFKARVGGDKAPGKRRT